MGRITVKIKVENSVDVVLALQGQLPPEQVRFIEREALVDTGASLLCLPAADINALGLTKIGKRRATTANGKVMRNIYGNAQLTVLNRTCTVDAIELTEDTPPLLGYIPLENLDLLPNPVKEILEPAHGDEIVLDLY